MLDLSNPAFHPVFERFKERLRESRERLGQLEAAIRPDAGKIFAEIRHLAHRLAGSAGTFGYDQVGTCASRLDRLLSDGVDDPPAVRAQLRDLLKEIDAAREPDAG